MKNNLGFNLTGKKLLPIWILFYAICIIPYVLLSFKLKELQQGGTPPLYVFPSLLGLLIVAYLLMFFIIKLVIQNVSYKEKTIDFNGKFGKFIGKILLGGFLSIITLGIYLAWFIKDISKFFIDNSSLNSDNFKFKGTGKNLFIILLATLVVPMFILFGVGSLLPLISAGSAISLTSRILIQILAYILLIPYFYYVYKWLVNIDYKNYNISWKTDLRNSLCKIAIEMFFSIITIGIYAPMAMIKLYTYFIEKTVATSADSERSFGFEKDNLNDFLFIWGQLLLTIVTLGIYYPWFISKVGHRFLSKSYLAE